VTIAIATSATLGMLCDSLFQTGTMVGYAYESLDPEMKMHYKYALEVQKAIDAYAMDTAPEAPALHVHYCRSVL
jgi:hypothetical protein